MEKEQSNNAETESDAKKQREAERNSSDKKLGRQIAFGIQQTLACWATDFIDPPVSRYLQNKFGNKDHEVTHKHVWYGEILGDSSAFFTYLGIKQFFSKPVDWAIGATRNAFNGYFEKMGKKTLNGWAKSHHLTEDDPRYKKKLEAYKDFQAENTVDSTIIASSATLANVAIQRAVGNKQAYAVILGSKLVGAAATMSVMLGLRTALPTATKALDDELSDRYFSKLVRFTQKLVGAKQVSGSSEFEVDDDKESEEKKEPRNEPLAYDKRQRFLASLQRSYSQNPGYDIKSFVAEQKRICQALVQALYPEGRFAKKLSEQYRQAIQGAGEDGAGIDSYMEDMLLHRRDAMLARLKLLDDPAFVAELESTLKSNKTFITAIGVSTEKKEKLITGLMQARSEDGIKVSAGQQRHHQEALLKAFDPNSEAARVLADSLSTQLGGADMKAAATAYMNERQEAARNVRLVLEEHGEIVSEAIQRTQKAQPKSISWQNVVTAKAAKGSEVTVAA